MNEKNIANVEMLLKDFLKHGYYGPMFTSLFVHSFQKLGTKCYKSITIGGSSGKP